MYFKFKYFKLINILKIIVVFYGFKWVSFQKVHLKSPDIYPIKIAKVNLDVFGFMKLAQINSTGLDFYKSGQSLDEYLNSLEYPPPPFTDRKRKDRPEKHRI